MNKILIEVSVGELLDKISILEIKQEKIKDTEKLKFINEEHSILKDQLNKNVKSDQKLNELFETLKKINAKLWICLLYTSPSPRDSNLSRMPSSA